MLCAVTIESCASAGSENSKWKCVFSENVSASSVSWASKLSAEKRKVIGTAANLGFGGGETVCNSYALVTFRKTYSTSSFLIILLPMSLAAASLESVSSVRASIKAFVNIAGRMTLPSTKKTGLLMIAHSAHTSLRRMSEESARAIFRRMWRSRNFVVGTAGRDDVHNLQSPRAPRRAWR